ncbi:MAG: hypothetical protein ACK4VO_04465 [Pseudobdellovibrio sp.]
MTLKPLIVFIWIFLIHVCVSSQEQIGAKSDPSFEEQFIEKNKEITNWFDNVTDGLDVFLVGKRLTQKKNPSYFKIINTTSSTEGDNFSNETSLNLNVRLQNVEQYFQVKFTATDEKSSNRAVTSSYLRRKNENKTYAATFGLFRKLGRMRTSFQPRIELQDPLKISNSIIFESLADFEKFELHPKLEFFASAYKGTGLSQDLNFYVKLNNEFALIFPNEFEYQDRIHKFFSSNGISLEHDLSSKSALSYGLIFDSNNRESYHLESYDISVSYKRIIYKNILDMQLTPHLEFQKERRFKGAIGFIASFGLRF